MHLYPGCDLKLEHSHLTWDQSSPLETQPGNQSNSNTDHPLPQSFLKNTALLSPLFCSLGQSLSMNFSFSLPQGQLDTSSRAR